MEIDIFASNETGQLQPIGSPRQLQATPRIGEIICFIAGFKNAKVEAVEYWMAGTPGGALARMILDRVLAIPNVSG